MKITICGSMTFAKEMLKVKQELEKLGHRVEVPEDTEHHVSHPGFIDDLESDFAHAAEKNLMRNHMQKVADSEAVLVLNYPKNGVEGYIGTSTLMEMGIGYFLKKKIFLLNPPPDMHSVRWAIEVRLINPTIIHSDFSLIV